MVGFGVLNTPAQARSQLARVAAIALAGMLSRALDDAPSHVGGVVAVAVWPALALLMSTMLAVLYRFAPDRKNPQWRWTTWGAAGATVLWAATTAALFIYVQNLGTYGTTYGSLAGVAISMLWLWLTVLLVVFGAAVNGESERQTIHRTRHLEPDEVPCSRLDTPPGSGDAVRGVGAGPRGDRAALADENADRHPDTGERGLELRQTGVEVGRRTRRLTRRATQRRLAMMDKRQGLTSEIAALGERLCSPDLPR